MIVTCGAWGLWYVTENGKQLAGPFDSNAQAWRWIDRHNGDPISRGESVSDWIVQKNLEGEAR